ncbi:MAG: type II toxin-antitoxin system HicA family toxin [Burkholderiaceae bacterium]|nr:type II toxin-antitoxin system HicA family toxin [Burkholderiaceae bacterium]
MPEIPGLSGQDLVRALQRLGFAVVRQSGGHVVLRQGARGCVVSNHKELKVGTVNGVLRQAGVSPEQLMSVL